MKETPLLYTIPDAAALLSLSPRRIYELIGEGRLAALKLGPGRNGARRIAAAELHRFIREAATNGTATR